MFAGMFHVYRYAMAKTKEVPPPPGSRVKMTKSIASSDVKELPPPDKIPLDTATTKGIEKSSEVTTTSTETPEIKPKSADLENNKDPNIGMSDLTKP